MSRFLILDDAVHRQATDLGTTVEDLQRVLQQYHGTAQNTFTNWIGLGAEAFQQFDARFQSIAQGLVTSLETLRAEVDAAGIDYDNNETAQQAAVNALRGFEWVPQAPADATAPPARDGGDGGGGGGDFLDGVGDFFGGVGDFFGGVAHPFREMWDSAWQLFTDPGEWLDQTWDGIYDSVAFWNWDTFVETWKETGKDFVAWDEWDDNWPRALGITITNVGLTVATLGVGALAIKLLLKRRGGGNGNNGDGDGGNGDDGTGDDGGGGRPNPNQEINEVFANPRHYVPDYTVTPDEFLERIGGVPEGWQETRLGQGTHQGQGWRLLEVDENGNLTGRQIRWHPGGGRHGPDPYWTFSSPGHGKEQVYNPDTWRPGP